MRSVTRMPIVLAIVLVTAVSGVCQDDDAHPITQGTLYVSEPGDGDRNQLPLEHTDVKIVVSGTTAEVQVSQRFVNTLDDRLEAVYVFPLPDRAAVDGMTIQVGDRRIVGEIHRREEARQIYEQAVAEGRLAGLLDQERANIFTQRVANILPGESIEVVIHYVEDLRFDHGAWQLVFPMVVGPRYIPGRPVGHGGGGWAADTDQVPDASNITPPVLPPGQRSGHDISLSVELAPGFGIRTLSSPSHQVELTRHSEARSTVTLSASDAIPNKDFVLDWSTAAAAVESTVVAHKLGDEGYLSLILQPPAEPADDQVAPRELVFVLDTSGSMSGEPIAACKQLIRKALRRMRADDTFRLIRFAGSSDQLDPSALPATADNIERALSYLDGMRGGGGTEMLQGVRAALSVPADPFRLRMVLFLTDGYIGNENEIITKVSEQLGNARIFSLGVGTSVNRFLLDRLAEAGRGVAEYLRPGEAPDRLVDRFYARITDPVFTQLELDWGGIEVFDVEPRRLPDLFAGQPLLIHARYRGRQRGTVSVRGFAGTRRRELATDVVLPRREAGNASQAQLWARARIARLEIDKLQSPQTADSITAAITELALAHRLMSAYTSFVAVDRSEQREGDRLITVDQPVPMPEGVSHEGVFGRSAKKSASNAWNLLESPASEAPLRFALRGSASPADREELHRTQQVAIPDPTPQEPERMLGNTGDQRTAAAAPATASSAGSIAPPPALPHADVDVASPVLVRRVEPTLPDAAIRARIAGGVVLQTSIDPQGRVTEVTVLRGLPLGLTESAVAAVRQWRFEPTIVNGVAVPVKHNITVSFRLDGVPAVNVPESGVPTTEAPTTPRLPVSSPEIPLVTMEELSHLAFSSFLLMLLLSSGAWLLRRALT